LLSPSSSMVAVKEEKETNDDNMILAWREDSKDDNVWKLGRSWLSIAISLIALSIIILLSDDGYYEDEDGMILQNRVLIDESVDGSDGITLLPLKGSDYVGFFCATIGLIIAAGGGIGGGGILVPIYILVMGFSPKHAIPLSNITVFGGAVANTILNTPKRHPLADRPLVDWNLILVMEPLTIGGALIGAMLNKVLPEEVIIVALIVLLGFTAYKSLRKGIKIYQNETIHFNQEILKNNPSIIEFELFRDKVTTKTKMSTSTISIPTGVVQSSGKSIIEYAELGGGGRKQLLNPVALMINATRSRALPNDDDDVFAIESKSILFDEESSVASDSTNESMDIMIKEVILHNILEEERRVPMKNVAILVFLFVVVLFINIVKGGGAFSSPFGIQCGSLAFWGANIFMWVIILLVNYIARSYLVWSYHLKRKVDYKYVEGDIGWDPRATIVYPSICMLAGFFAGMFGIGGGIVKGPLMLAMGVHPAVSSATSACMILFTSFTATTSFMVFGLLQYNYAIVCLTLGFCATIVGQLGLGCLMKKYQRNSYIVFSIGTVVLLSAILMTAQAIVSLVKTQTTPSYEIGGHICGVGAH